SEVAGTPFDGAQPAAAPRGEAQRSVGGAEIAEAGGLLKCYLRRKVHQPLRRRSDVLRKTAIRIIQELADGMRKKAEVALEGGGATEHRLARAAIRTQAPREPRNDVNKLTRGH